MLPPSPNHKPKAERVDAFATLADFKLAVIDAMAARNESAMNDLLDNFTVDDQTARRISWE